VKLERNIDAKRAAERRRNFAGRETEQLQIDEGLLNVVGDKRYWQMCGRTILGKVNLSRGIADDVTEVTGRQRGSGAAFQVF
jgi:hypothetical protein